MSEDPILCYCFGVKRAEVLAHFANQGARLEDLVARTGVSTRCTACAVDLDLMLDEIQSSEQRMRARTEELAISQSGFRSRVNRVDSGFLLCDDDVKTSIRLANYPPPSQNIDLCTPHLYRVTLFDNDGRICCQDRGKVDVQEEKAIELSNLPGCPREGWFLLDLQPQGPGRYGTLRPQAAFQGKDWAACYHTQFHTFASRSGRRSGAPLRTIGSLTRTVISVINGSSHPSRYWATIESHDGSEEVQGNLAGHGACFLDIDAAFTRRPANAFLIFRIRSEKPTRKNLIYRHPDGSLGFDHFPNLV
jgi:bacterioferritin-associated ferredoxin